MNSHDEYPCRQCRGSKMIDSSIPIGRICPQCNGKGYTDWITNAMGDRYRHEEPDHQILYNMVMRNIQQLTTEIKQQGMQLGIVIDINIEMRNERDFMNDYLCTPQRQIIPR